MWLCLTPRLKPSLSYQWSPFLFLPPLSSIESIFLFLLFHLPASSFEGFTYHQRTPAISSKTANPARYSGDVGCIQLRKALSKAHGILMIVAWPGLAGTAMLFAAFLKPVLKKGKWFQVWHDKIWDPSGLNLSSSSSLPPSSSLILPPSSSLPHPSLTHPPSLIPSQVHRALMLLSVLVGVGAFVLIFVAHADSTPPGLMALTEVHGCLATIHKAAAYLRCVSRCH